MGRGKKRSKKKAIPERMGSDSPSSVVPAPCLPSGDAVGAAKDAPVVNHECINCDNCGIANPQKCCSRCLCAYYCSKDCQRAHWKDRKQGCTILKDERGHYDAARDRNNLPGETPAVIDGPCAICLEEEVKHPITFQCGHVFCFECVYKYQCKEMQATCPYCRGEIPNVFDKARDRYQLYSNRALFSGEGSEERKKYCHLALAEHDALYHVCEDSKVFLYWKAQIMSVSNDPEALLEVTDEILSEIQSGGLKLDHEDFATTKLWWAEAYSGKGKWTDASEIYSELRKEDQLGNSLNEFQLEMGYCRCLFELGDHDKAVECGNRAVNIRRMHPGVHEYLALAQKAAGNIDAAKKTMFRAILHEEPWNIENLERNKQILRSL